MNQTQGMAAYRGVRRHTGTHQILTSLLSLSEGPAGTPEEDPGVWEEDDGLLRADA